MIIPGKIKDLDNRGKIKCPKTKYLDYKELRLGHQSCPELSIEIETCQPGTAILGEICKCIELASDFSKGHVLGG